MEEHKQIKFLKALALNGNFLITGSYARGEQTELSDIDFQIKTPRECIVYGSRNKNIEFLIKLLDVFEIKWNSTRTGYISTIGEENNLLIEMEFYDNFHRSKEKIDALDLYGAVFKTY